jgi:hypothetical protein
MPQLVWLTIAPANAIHKPEVSHLDENQQKPTAIDEPDDPAWYLQAMYEQSHDPEEFRRMRSQTLHET